MYKVQLKKWDNIQYQTMEGIKLVEYTTLSLMTECLKHIPQGGIGALEMKKRIDVLTKIERAKGKDLLLENAEYEELKKCIDAVTWSFVDKCFIEFDDSIRKAVKQS